MSDRLDQPRARRARRWLQLGILAGAALGLLTPAAEAQGRGEGKKDAASSASVPSDNNLRLEIGTQQVLPADNVRSYSEGVQGVIDVRLTGDAKSFVIVALRPGNTTLLFIMMDGSERLYKINVFDPNAAKPVEKKLGPPREQVLTRDNIRLDFYFVQFDKSYHHQIGVDWASRYGGGSLSVFYDLQTGNFENATATIQDQALPALDLAQATGWAKLQRHATLITANGTKATFMGGGEINIPVQGSLSTGIHKIEFGSTIGVQPRYDSESGRLELEIHADVSDLADDRGTGTPGRLTSTLDTLVNLELGQSLMLAGLTASSQSRGHSGLPVLSQIPIIGALFGTHTEAQQETEDVVFIVPSVLDSVSMDSRTRIRDALDAYEDYTGDLDKHHLHAREEIPTPKKPAGGASSGSSVVLEPEGK
jgi:pilus assembly protein CpaC